MRLILNIQNQDYEKFKLIQIFNKTMADWNRGIAAVQEHERNYEGFHYIQESLITNTENKIKYEIYKKTLEKFVKAQEKLDSMLQKLTIELLEKYKINLYGCDYCNPYDFVKIKMVEVNDE